MKKSETVMDIARQVERKASDSLPEGGFLSILVSAAEFASNPSIGGSELLKRKTVHNAHSNLYDPRKIHLHNERFLKNSIKLNIAVLLLYLLWGFLGINSMKTFFLRSCGFSDTYLTDTILQTLEYSEFLPKYDDLKITVDAEGALPGEGTVRIEYEDENSFEIPLKCDDMKSGIYTAKLESPGKNLFFRINLGDAESDEKHIKVIPQPFIEEGKITAYPPEYSLLPKKEYDICSLKILEGTKISFEIKPDKKIEKAFVVFPGKQIEMKESSGLFYTDNLIIHKDSSFYFRLIDEKGIENKDRLNYSFMIQKDAVPTVKIMQPETGTYYAPASILHYKLKASDDFGLKSIKINYTVFERNEDGEKVKLKTDTLLSRSLKNEKELEFSADIRINTIGVESGQLCVLQALTLDNCRTRGVPVYAKSEKKQLFIVTASELKKIIEEKLLQFNRTVKDVENDMKIQLRKVKMMEKKYE